jgi:hypothetical protein
MRDTPRIEVTIAAPPEAVWNALRDKERIRHWHGWDDPSLDAEIDLIYFQHVATEDAEKGVLDIQGGDLFELHPEGDGTKVVLTRAAHGDNPEWEAYYDDITEGWITFMHQLKFACERHPADPRRTVFLSGTIGTAAPPAEQLGVAGLTEGSAYDAELAGERVHGTVWFVSEHQLGLTVDEWGDGLLVVSGIAPSEQKPDGAAMAVLSTYGLDPASYDALNGRWTDWWQPRFPQQT